MPTKIEKKKLYPLPQNTYFNSIQLARFSYTEKISNIISTYESLVSVEKCLESCTFIINQALGSRYSKSVFLYLWSVDMAKTLLVKHINYCVDCSLVLRCFIMFVITVEFSSWMQELKVNNWTDEDHN